MSDSPYAPQARYGNKRATVRRGCKVHFTEICDADCPFLIASVETTAAMIPGITMGAPIHESLKKKKLLPATHLVDSGYVEAKWIVQSAKEEKVRIVEPPRPNTQRYWRKNGSPTTSLYKSESSNSF